MKRLSYLKSAALGGASVVALATGAFADEFAIPSGDLASALDSYTRQTGVALLISGDALTGAHTNGARGTLTASEALTRLLKGTGFAMQRDQSGAVAIVPLKAAHIDELQPQRLAQAAPHSSAAAGIESVVVTSSKIKGDIQTVPIAITALSQEQLTERQIAGGPDLVKEVPNLTFTKTNFTGYNLQIRGIGTQAISVTIDPAVAVAFNDTPFLRNHFFEQEFYDLSQAEVLRGPQGTLYGRNSNAGVVNLVSSKPINQFEAMLSADLGNYKNRRYEGMVNIPIVDDTLALRIAGEWTKRDGYTFNETTGTQIDGRDLWSSRISLGWKPFEGLQTYLIWEHFQEHDDRLRSGKQLCKTDPGPATLTAADGSTIPVPPSGNITFAVNAASFSQGCLPTSLYDTGDPAHGDYGNFGVPNGFSLPFISGIGYLGSFSSIFNANLDPYTQVRQSTNLRNIQATIEPIYKAKNDTLEFNAEWTVTPALTLSSDTGYNNDFLWSVEDYNRFDTTPGAFLYNPTAGFSTDFMMPDPTIPGAAILCDPQVGCSSRVVVEDLSTERAWQFSQEFRLASDFKGPFNFSAGVNYLHYETVEKYYVFSNIFTTFVACPAWYNTHWHQSYVGCLDNGKAYLPPFAGGSVLDSHYNDPNPFESLDDQGHNYFLSKNPYVLNSYAAFGEAYYDVTPEIKLTAGVRWTDDEKHFVNYPSQLLAGGYGYPSTGAVDQKWGKWTGRFVANWSPKLDFTDQSMFYATYSHGYKAGGANPPGAVLLLYGGSSLDHYNIPFPVHPLTYAPEFIDAFELGSKNTALDGNLTLNADVFYYDYKGYQISQIVDRTSVNINVDAKIQGAELQVDWSPLPGFKLGFNGGYEDTRLNNNQYFIDLQDRTAGQPGWVLMKPWVGQSSNCVFPDYVAAALVQAYQNGYQGNQGAQACGVAYHAGLDPITQQPYSGTPITIAATTINGIPVPAISYPGFDPLAGTPADAYTGQNTAHGFDYGPTPNNGEGFVKNIGGNELPNAPHFTASFTGAYTMPISENWAATLHSDFYWQSQFWARIFNSVGDKARGYSNMNLAVILNDTTGWQIMGYVKNVFDKTAITGTFLNSDDSGLTTNVFMTDPRLYGLRVTKHFDAGDDLGLFSGSDGGRPQLWLQVGGDYSHLSADTTPYAPPFEHLTPTGLPTFSSLEKSPTSSFEKEASLSFQPEKSDWVLKAGIRYGRAVKKAFSHESLPPHTRSAESNGFFSIPCKYFKTGYISPAKYDTCHSAPNNEFEETRVRESEKHAILDFTLGKDVGLGLFGRESKSTIAAGVRIAQFDSRTRGSINTDPHYNFPVNVSQKYHDVFNATTAEDRSFHGIGPELAWDANTVVWGEAAGGQITFDWGANAAILFGRQKAQVEHQLYQNHCTNGPLGLNQYCSPVYVPATKVDTFARTKRITVPNLGGYIGASVRYSNAKVSFGYRADEFFGAMDGGQDTAKKYNRGFMGPYLNLSVGFGG